MTYDKEPKKSINQLKALRKRWKYAPRDNARKDMLAYLNDVIAYKQALYFQFAQHVKRFQWGMSLRRR